MSGIFSAQDQAPNASQREFECKSEKEEEEEEELETIQKRPCQILPLQEVQLPLQNYDWGERREGKERRRSNTLANSICRRFSPTTERIF